MDAEYPNDERGAQKLAGLAEDIKKAGQGKKYDCIIGVSGGCDSSYLVYYAKEKLGLRPLAVHFDNTWNTTIATMNIHKVLRKLDVDLYTLVVNNEEFNDLATSFLKASVPEIEALTDIALATTLYRAAVENDVKYIFNGHNFRTEGITPLGMFYFDGKYIDSVHSQYGTREMKTFPNLWLGQWIRWLFKDIKRVRPIYYMQFDKEHIKNFLNEEFEWQWYGGHHQENRYTTFSNRYYLPRKFGIDFRYVEFSALIRSGQMTREDALEKMKKPPECPLEHVEEVKKRLGYSDEEFETMMNAPKRSVADFKTYHPTFRAMRPFFWLMYKWGRVPKSFYIKYTKK
jgi:N-acetyl sugar amidotransferase